MKRLYLVMHFLSKADWGMGTQSLGIKHLPLGCKAIVETIYYIIVLCSEVYLLLLQLLAKSVILIPRNCVLVWIMGCFMF